MGRGIAVVDDLVVLRDVLRQEKRFKLAAILDSLEDLFSEVLVRAAGEV